MKISNQPSQFTFYLRKEEHRQIINQFKMDRYRLTVNSNEQFVLTPTSSGQRILPNGDPAGDYPFKIPFRRNKYGRILPRLAKGERPAKLEYNGSKFLKVVMIGRPIAGDVIEPPKENDIETPTDKPTTNGAAVEPVSLEDVVAAVRTIKQYQESNPNVLNIDCIEGDLCIAIEIE